MTPSSESLQALTDTLWSQRRVAELLLCKLVTAELLLAAGRGRFVAPALHEVERSAAALGEAELRRTMAAMGIASRWRLPVEELTVSMLVARAPVPWRDAFGDHRDALRALGDEICAAAAATRRLATDRLAAIHPVDPDPVGRAAVPAPGAVEGELERRAEELACRDLVRISGKVPPPSLVAFLG